MKQFHNSFNSILSASRVLFPSPYYIHLPREWKWEIWGTQACQRAHFSAEWMRKIKQLVDWQTFIDSTPFRWVCMWCYQTSDCTPVMHSFIHWVAKRQLAQRPWTVVWWAGKHRKQVKNDDELLCNQFYQQIQREIRIFFSQKPKK